MVTHSGPVTPFHRQSSAVCGFKERQNLTYSEEGHAWRALSPVLRGPGPSPVLSSLPPPPPLLCSKEQGSALSSGAAQIPLPTFLSGSLLQATKTLHPQPRYLLFVCRGACRGCDLFPGPAGPCLRDHDSVGPGSDMLLLTTGRGHRHDAPVAAAGASGHTEGAAAACQHCRPETGNGAP